VNGTDIINLILVYNIEIYLKNKSKFVFINKYLKDIPIIAFMQIENKIRNIIKNRKKALTTYMWNWYHMSVKTIWK